MEQLIQLSILDKLTLVRAGWGQLLEGDPQLSLNLHDVPHHVHPNFALVVETLTQILQSGPITSHL